MDGWMDVRHTLERNVLTQLKRADKYEREEGWDGPAAGSLAAPGTARGGEMKDSPPAPLRSLAGRVL